YTPIRWPHPIRRLVHRLLIRRFCYSLPIPSAAVIGLHHSFASCSD
ncbi:hypothetical protein Gotur_007643, partial [Gossypium turneri]